ncbi:DUF2892 domain-containing protein [Undibacterium sp. CY18W]|uniref:DUF2892 domain-containing protein n=2 Tax=Undibacterium hunanense TaxID=2762292 RepID=A0ABR6ZXJ4_9BURK|nr:DUF2892 domain-containing protein [Undibacterium hunanense]
MLYMKNLPSWERLLRIVAGLACLVFTAMNWGIAGLSVLAGISGAMAALTGLIGFCPMCALLGRKPVARKLDRNA